VPFKTSEIANQICGEGEDSIVETKEESKISAKDPSSNSAADICGDDY
jgi:hypothetical protein